MKDFPETFQDFIDNFATETQCREYMSKIKWVNGFVCPKCKNKEAWNMGKCVKRCKECRSDISVMKDTVFEQSKMPLRIWFQTMWYMVSQKQGVSAFGLAKLLGIKRATTVWNMMQKIRGVMVKTSPNMLSGLVEIDEVFLGGVRTGKRGRGAEGKTLILVAVEDKGKAGFGRIRMQIIQNATEKTLRKAIQEMVAVGSTIRTDQHRGYPIITKHGYMHVPIAKVAHELGEDNTPLVHRVASLLKRWLLGTHQGGVHSEHLTSYLNEYTFRFNRRTSKSRGRLFYGLVQNMISSGGGR